MALLLNDGFGLYDSAAGALTAKGWTAAGSASFGTGRVSTSRFVQLTGSGGTNMVQTFAGFSGATSIVGAAVLWQTGGSVPADIVSVSVGGSAVRLVFTSVSGAIHLALYKDSTQVADVGAIASATWYHVELKVDWATAGNVAVRIDGSEYHNAAMTLAAPTAGLTVGLRNAFAGSGFVQITDLLVMDGSGSTFNGFQGDVTIETLFPGGAGATTGWTPTRPVLAVTNKTLFSNLAVLTVTPAPHGVNVGETITVAGVDATFNGTHTVTQVTFSDVRFALVAANVTSVASGGSVASTPANWQAVDESYATNNGDNDYVTTATVNAIDTYAMRNLATSASSPVLAVRPVVVARKESAAIMGIATVVRSAGTDYIGTPTDLTNTLVYNTLSETLTADPATTAAWTRAAVDAIEVGQKKTA